MDDDIIAKNLLENKICKKCKYKNSLDLCCRIKSIDITCEDVEVFINGTLATENHEYIINNNVLHFLQWKIDSILTGYTRGYNDQSNVGEPLVNAIVVERTIENNKIVKKLHKVVATQTLPQEETCIAFLDADTSITM